jgi:hypothetical protein
VVKHECALDREAPEVRPYVARNAGIDLRAPGALLRTRDRALAELDDRRVDEVLREHVAEDVEHPLAVVGVDCAENGRAINEGSEDAGLHGMSLCVRVKWGEDALGEPASPK